MKSHLADHLIGLMSDQNPHLLVGMLGILQAGSGFVPLDPDYPDERIGFIIQDCRFEILVTEGQYLSRLLEISATCPSLKHVICLDEAPQLSATRGAVSVYDCHTPVAQDPPARPSIVPEQLAYVVYTSGSTGAPKGVPIAHGNLIPLFCWSREYFGFDAHSRVLQNLNPCFDFGIFELLTTVLFGGAICFLEKEQRADLAAYPEHINAWGINTIHATPSFFAQIAALGDRLETLDIVHLGGELLTGKMVDDTRQITGDGCTIYNGYGPTEATINCAIFRVDRAAPPASIPIGKASANNLAYILDANYHPVPIAVPGELYVGGGGLARGYLNRPALTAERFIPHPFGHRPGARLYKTGDLTRYLPDGNIEFLGRIDNQVKIRGFRIELGEIEAVLNQHPTVQKAVVVVRQDQQDQMDKRLVAYFVPNPQQSDGLNGLRRFLQERLPNYMLPSAFVTLAALPLTPNGKIDRRALPAPDAENTGLAETFVAPRNQVEIELAEIWQQVLGVHPIGVTQSFFELGGHSLLVTQLFSRIREAFQIDFSLAVLFEKPTIEALAETIIQHLIEQADEQAVATALHELTGL